MIKAVIFDLDGTLLNTLEDICFVLNESLKKFGLPEVTLEQTKQYVGNGAKRLVQRAVGNKPDIVGQVYDYYAKIFAECGNSRTKLYDGEEQALTILKETGIKLAIVTNKPQQAANNVYNSYLKNFGFCKVLGQTADYPLKPDPASTLAIIGELGLKKEECIFVGDGETDVQTARSAGIKCISVLWGYRSKQQLTASGADIFAGKFGDIPDIIKKQNF